LSVLQESLIAEATDDAVASADGARMGIGAGGRASGTAGQEALVFTAFRDWWQHHERRRWGGRRAFAGLNALAFFRTQVAGFASATGFANARAQRVGVLARAVATFAFAVFFVLGACWHWWEHHEG